MAARTLPRPVTTLGPSAPCRCSGETVGPHPSDPSCYRPGRAPDSDGPPALFTAWELDERFELAFAEGYDQAEHDLDADRIAIGDVVTAMRKIKSSKLVRETLAELLECAPDDLNGEK